MIEQLSSEIESDPLGRGYSQMTDIEVAQSLNTPDRTRIRSTLTSAEIYENIVASEFASKTADQKQLVRDILGLGDGIQVGPGSQARTVMIGVFGGTSQTIAALAESLEEPVSRADELGIGTVEEKHVRWARNQ